MNTKTIFYLTRHGQTQWNVESRIQGQLDSPLTEKGRQQAVSLASSCESLGLTNILTSPLGRAFETAKICATCLNLNVQQLKGLEERNFGVWQGKLTAEMALDNDYDEICSLVTDYQPKQGESAQQVLIRFEAVLRKELKRQPNNVPLIVIHGEVLRCFMSQLAGANPKATGYDYKNGQLIALCYDQKTDQFSRL